MPYLYGNIHKMAKKKKTAQRQTFLSPEQYVREKARTLAAGDVVLNNHSKRSFKVTSFWTTPLYSLGFRP